jgi:hypothetical protein
MLRNPRTPLETRLADRTAKTDTCWLWQGAKTPKGYGLISLGSHPTKDYPINGYTHRIAFELAYGPIPDGLLVLHTCDTPLCCRNDDDGWYEINGVLRPRRGHLWIGTSAENTADMIAKGRQATGSRWQSRGNADTRLTEESVREIRRRHALGGVTYGELASAFGVNRKLIGCIIHRKTWKHVVD